MDFVYLSETSSSESSTDYSDIGLKRPESRLYSIGGEKYDENTLQNMIHSTIPETKEELKSIIIQSIQENHVEALQFFTCNHYSFYDILIEESGQTAIHIAYYRYSHPYIINELANLIPDDQITCTDCYGLTYLHIGCWSKSTALIDKCLKSGIDVDAQINFDPDGFRSGYTALHFACTASTEIVDALIKRGANVNANDFLGRKPLHLACRDFHFSDTGFSDMNSLAHLKILELLLDSGCDINSKDINGNTPLLSIFPEDFGWRFSQKYPLKKTILKLKYLLVRGADSDLTNNDNDSMLHRAMRISFFSIDESYDWSINEAKHEKLIEIILNANKVIHVDSSNALGETPLQLAISLASVHTVKILLNYNANLSCLTFSQNDQYAFCYPNKIPTLKVVKSVINIIEIILEKKFILSLEENLIIMKFLVHDIKNCDCAEKSGADWDEVLNFVSPSHLKDVLMKVINEQPDKKIKKTNLRAAKDLFYAKKIAGVFFDKEIMDFLERVKLGFTLEEEEVAEIEAEISRTKSTVLFQKVTLYDILVKSPNKIYHTVMKSNFFELALEESFPFFKNTIRGHVNKSLIRHYITNFAHNYFNKLIFPSFPICCSNIILNYLSNEEILHLCSAAVLLEYPVL